MGERRRAVTPKHKYLHVGNGSLEVYVLDDGTSVFTQRGGVKALTDGGAEHGSLDRYLDRLSNVVGPLTLEPKIEFSLPDGGVANGRPASDLITICEAYIKAATEGKLRDSQRAIAAQAQRLLGAFARTGVDAVIWDITGYRGIRASDRLFAYLRDEQDNWRGLWTGRCRDALAKLYGWNVVEGRWPRQAAGIMSWIYRLSVGDEVYAEMKRRTPLPRHKNNLHQWVNDTVREMLVDDIRAVATIADQSGSREELRRRVYYHFRKAPLQLALLEKR